MPDLLLRVLIDVHCGIQLIKCYYRPQRSCGKVMFLHLSVILSTGRGLSTSVHAGIHTPPGQTPPQQTATAADEGGGAVFVLSLIEMDPIEMLKYQLIS